MFQYVFALSDFLPTNAFALRMCRLEIGHPESAQCYPTLGRLTSAQP